MEKTPPATERAAPAASWRDGIPGGFLAALALAGGFIAFVAWDQSHWWRVKEDYSFGWLVPVFTVYAVYDRWEKLRDRLRAATEAPPAARWVRWTLNTAAVLGLVFGALFFLLGAFYRAGAGTSQPGTMALTLGMVAIVLPLIFFNVPARPAAAPAPSSSVAAGGPLALFKEPRFAVAALFVFPVGVWTISAPLVSALESQISLFLLRKVVTVVAFMLDLAGCPIEQQGNVLMLPKGPVGVADACSGIRSLTACLFAGSFLGAMFLGRFWKKAALVGAAMVFAFVTNLARSLFLTAWAYKYGPDAITGFVHDAAGYAVLGLTCLGLLALVPLLNLKLERVAAAGAEGSEGEGKLTAR